MSVVPPRLLLSLLARCLLCCFIKNHLNFAISCFQGRLLSASQTAITIIIPFLYVHDSQSFNYQFWCRPRILYEYTFSTWWINFFSENKWFWEPSVYINECCNLMWASVNKSKGSTQKQTCLYNAECMNLPVCESSGSLKSYVIMQTGKKG